MSRKHEEGYELSKFCENSEVRVPEQTIYHETVRQSHIVLPVVTNGGEHQSWIVGKCVVVDPWGFPYGRRG